MSKKEHVFIDGVECIECYCCKKFLPIEEFYKNRTTSDGITHRCKQCDKEQRNLEVQKKYYYKNAEKCKDLSKKNREENKERVSAYNKKYSEEHGKELREKRIKRYSDNIEYYKKKQKAFRERMISEHGPRYERYMELKCFSDKRRRARKRQCLAILTRADFEEALVFFEYKDAYTGLPMENITQDHIIPLSKGGSHIKWNVIPCDLKTNASKFNNVMETWYKKQPFFSEKRLAKIKQWMGYKKNSNVLQTALL